MKRAIYPGSFDPWHEGHESIYMKALKLFDEVIIYVTFNPEKNNTKNIKDRAMIISQKLPNSKVISGIEMTSDVAKRTGSKYIIRGIRDNFDLNYEINLAYGNKVIDESIETILLLADEDSKTISSTTLKMIEKSKKIIKEAK